MHPPTRRLARILAAIAALVLLEGPGFPLPAANPGEGPAEPGNYDIRIHGGSTLAALEGAYGPAALAGMRRAGREALRKTESAMKALRRMSPPVEASRSPFTGGLEIVGSHRGFLDDAIPGRSSTQTALTFLRRNAAAYGLDPRQVDEMESLGESVSRTSGLRMVRLVQRVNGIPVFQSETRAVLDREGRLVRTVGRLVPGLDGNLVPAVRGLRKPEEALHDALASVGLDLDLARLRSRASRDDPAALEVVSQDSRLVRPVRSEQVYFPLGAGVAVPAWAQVAFLKERIAWYTVVDGRTGILLYRKNLRQNASKQEARFSVYAGPNGHPLECPAPGSPNHLAPGSGTQFPAVARSIVSMFAVQDPIASPNGWIPDRGETTTGNNVDAYLSRSGDGTPDLGTLDLDGRPMGNPDAGGRNRDFLGGAPRDYGYTPAPLGSDPDAGDDPSTVPFQRGVVTDLFYLVNWFHDRTHALGFDEAAGNFQNTNFQPGGKRGDPMQALAQADFDLGGVDTAYSINPPDGESGQVAAALFTAPGPDRDSGLDAPIVLHELTHGMTSRLIGNAAGLNWGPGQGLSEGWSDFYSMALVFDRPGQDPDAQYTPVGYSTYLMNRGLVPPGSFTDNYLYGLRRFPYTTDNSVNPLTWADIDETTIDMSGGIAPAPFGWERFGASEGHLIGELWALSLWEARSRIIAADGGDVPAGNAIALQVVTDALKMTPLDPTFIEARDALLEADCATNACSHEEAVWGGFADRGLGYGARDSGGVTYRMGMAESFSLPYLDVAAVVVDDAAGNGNGFPEPGETVSLTVRLFNPWRHVGKGVPSAQANLSTSTAGVTLIDGASSYGAIPARGTADGDPFVVQLGSGLGCGERMQFSVQTSSALGTGVAAFALRVGRPSGTGAPVTYTRTIPGGLAMPDRDFAGVIDPLAIAQDLEIADLDFRADDVSHTYVGNLSFSLRAPDGLSTTLIYRPGICSRKFCSQAVNDGDNFIATRIDDASSNDLMMAGPTFAPFTGDWFPAFNSPLFDQPDPVRQLSGYNGRSTQGTWKLLAVDSRIGDTGAVNSWSIIVTPVAYACGP